MIVRIASEGQYRLDSALLDRVNELDNLLVERIATSDARAFANQFHALLDMVRTEGVRLEDDEILESQVILPAPDTTLEEAREFFTGEGMFGDGPSSGGNEG